MKLFLFLTFVFSCIKSFAVDDCRTYISQYNKARVDILQKFNLNLYNVNNKKIKEEIKKEVLRVKNEIEPKIVKLFFETRTIRDYRKLMDQVDILPSDRRKQATDFKYNLRSKYKKLSAELKALGQTHNLKNLEATNNGVSYSQNIVSKLNPNISISLRITGLLGASRADAFFLQILTDVDFFLDIQDLFLKPILYDNSDQSLPRSFKFIGDGNFSGIGSRSFYKVLGASYKPINLSTLNFDLLFSDWSMINRDEFNRLMVRTTEQILFCSSVFKD